MKLFSATKEHATDICGDHSLSSTADSTMRRCASPQCPLVRWREGWALPCTSFATAACVRKHTEDTSAIPLVARVEGSRLNESPGHLRCQTDSKWQTLFILSVAVTPTSSSYSALKSTPGMSRKAILNDRHPRTPRHVR